MLSNTLFIIRRDGVRGERRHSSRGPLEGKRKTGIHDERVGLHRHDGARCRFGLTRVPVAELPKILEFDC